MKQRVVGFTMGGDELRKPHARNLPNTQNKARRRDLNDFFCYTTNKIECPLFAAA